MNRLEWVNLAAFGSIGAYVAGYGILTAISTGYPQGGEWFWGFKHSPDTLIISGVGLIALTYKYKLYALPLFILIANLVENPWAVGNLTDIGYVQIILILFGYAATRPTFKNPVWVLLAVLMNQPGGQEYPLNYHHVAEIVTFLVFMFDIKSLSFPLKRSDLL